VKPILEVHNISKKFQIDHERSAYLSLRDRIAGVFKPKSKKEDFWALKDVSFNVMPGESIGIIGRNGAGKSTLLKILSRITPPTEGSITVRGRIASLLEVGTGFHQELTGRENIFMNGSILGMKNAEIKSRFDEIVDFSGVEKFLDTPLKNYSSGMQLRLAFAVAAHLEPEILIIDEVLAVGDAEFQKKCIGKMEAVKSQGKTVIFVSHSLGTVKQICPRGILLVEGSVFNDDNIEQVIIQYLHLRNHEIRHDIKFSLNPSDESGNWLAGSELTLSISWAKLILDSEVVLEVAIYSLSGVKILAFSSESLPIEDKDRLNIFKEIDLLIPNLHFTETELQLDIGLRYKSVNKYVALMEGCATLNPVGLVEEFNKVRGTILSPKLRYAIRG
jgi:ABC-type polysaccharide/polyol phosphate transport system ATPase subunit